VSGLVRALKSRLPLSASLPEERPKFAESVMSGVAEEFCPALASVGLELFTLLAIAPESRDFFVSLKI
jgi:hypothetical protein